MWMQWSGVSSSVSMPYIHNISRTESMKIKINQSKNKPSVHLLCCAPISCDYLLLLFPTWFLVCAENWKLRTNLIQSTAYTHTHTTVWMGGLALIECTWCHQHGGALPEASSYRILKLVESSSIVCTKSPILIISNGSTTQHAAARRRRT